MEFLFASRATLDSSRRGGYERCVALKAMAPNSFAYSLMGREMDARHRCDTPGGIPRLCNPLPRTSRHTPTHLRSPHCLQGEAAAGRQRALHERPASAVGGRGGHGAAAQLRGPHRQGVLPGESPTAPPLPQPRRKRAAARPHHRPCCICSPPLPPSLQAWQDEHHLLAGTKCNKLLQWDTASGRVRALPLPPAPPRDQPVEESLWGSCGIHAVAVNPAGDMVATGGAQPADCAVLRLPDFAPVQTLVVSVHRPAALPLPAAVVCAGRPCPMFSPS